MSEKTVTSSPRKSRRLEGSRSAHAGSRGRIAPPQRRRLGFEALEDRCLLSITLTGGQVLWEEQGPGTITGGQVEGLAGNAVSGAIQAIVTHPDEPGTVYVGTVNGGVWKTENATSPNPHWEPLTDQNLPSLSISALAMSPQNPSVLFAGTGRVSSFGGEGTEFGLFKTSNAGADWHEVDDSFKFYRRTITALASSYTSANVVVLATNDDGKLGGLFHSTDGGEHWTQISGAGGTSLPLGAVTDVVADPSNPGRMYAAIAGSGDANGIYRSDNDGTSWTRISGILALEEDGDGVDNDHDGAVDAADPGEGMNLATRIRLSVSAASPNPLYVGIVQLPRTTLAATADVFDTTLAVNDATNFQPGDKPSIDAFGPVTHLKNGEAIGSDTIRVNSTALFQIGDDVEVFFGPGQAERQTIINIMGDTLTLDEPLKHEHKTGDVVRRFEEAVEVVSVDRAANTITLKSPLTAVHGDDQTIVELGKRRLEAIVRYDPAAGIWDSLSLPETTETINGSLTPVGIHGGGQGDIHFSIVVDPANPNVIYVGGDAQPGDKPNSIGAQNHTGRIFRGVYTPAGTVWTPITHNFADPDGPGGQPGTAPHADSRDMAFNALGQILEADDGGIYRLSDPGNVGSVRAWTSRNGDLRISEIVSVGYDPLNGIVFTGNQDTGSAEQIDPANPFVWRTIGQGDGTVQGVEVVDADTVIRYTQLNDVGFFERREFDEQGNLTDTDAIGLKKGYLSSSLSGLLNEDRQTSARYVLNAVEPSRMLLGNVGLYETTGTNRGDVVQRIGAKESSRITTLAYGGRNADGTPNAGVVYAVRENGRIYVRTGFGANFSDYAIATTGGPAGRIYDIALDPDNWRIVYAVSDDRVYKSANAGANWSDITGTLAAGLFAQSSRKLRAVEVVKTAAGQTAVLVGGAGGVYRALDPQGAAPPLWSKLGFNLPNVLATDLRYEPSADVLVAGTLGRGAWTIAGAMANVDPKVLEIVGDDPPAQGGKDEIRLVRNNANPSMLDVFLNNTTQTSNLSLPIASLQAIVVRGGLGDDKLTIDSSAGVLNVPLTQYDGQDGANTLALVGASGQSEVFRDGPLAGEGTIVIGGDGLLQYVEFSNVNSLSSNIPPPASGKLKALRDGLAHVAIAAADLSNIDLLGKLLPVIGSSLGRAVKGVPLAEVERIHDEPAPATPQPSEQQADAGGGIFRRLIESGPGAFSIAEIASSLDTAEKVRAALDDLDDTPGNVTLTEVGNVTTFDVRVLKTLAGTADLAVDALGGTLDLEGHVEISADVALHIVVGIDADGFFIDADASGEPELVVGNVRIGGQLDAEGRFGMLGVTMAGATLAMDPLVKLSIDLADPGTVAADGMIRVYELQAAVTDWASATLTSNPMTDDLTLSATFAVAALPSGSAAPFDLADAQVRLSWADIANPAGVQVTATTSSGQDLLDFLNLSSQQVIDGISDTAALLQSIAGVDLLAVQIPLVGKSLGEILNAPPLELVLDAASVADVSAVDVQGGYKKFSVSLLDGNLWQQNVAVGDPVAYRGVGGVEYMGEVDEIGFARFVVRFSQTATQNPDTANPSFRIQRKGALDDQLHAALGKLTDPAELSTNAPTLQSLITELAELIGVDPETIPVGTSGTGSARVIELSLPLDPAPLVFNERLTFGTGIEGLTLDATGDVAVSVDPQFLLSMGLRVGAGIPAADRFYLVDGLLPAVTLDVTAHLDNPGVTGSMGFLRVKLNEDPAVTPNTGIDVSGTIDVSLTDPGSVSADGRITRSEFQSGNLLDVFDASIDATFDIDGLRLSADAGLTTTLGSIGVSLAGDSPSDPGHVQSLAELQNLPSQIVVTGLGDFLDFNNLTAQGVLAALEQLCAWLDQFGDTALFGTEIPFTDGRTIGDVLDLKQAFVARLTGPVQSQSGQPSYANAQELAEQLALSLGVDPSVVAANYDPATDELTFHLILSHDFAPVVVPIDLGLDLSPLAVLTSDSEVSLGATAGLELTIGIDLSPRVAVLSASADAPANGRLTSDAHVTLHVNEAAPVNVTLTSAATSTNTSLDDLVVDINAALNAAGLTGVAAARSGNRLTLSAVPSPASDSPLLRLSSAAGDAAITQLRFVNGDVATDSTARHFFIEDASVSGSVDLTAADVDVSARIGFLDVGIVDGSAAATAGVTVGLKDAATGTPGGRMTLDELFDHLSGNLASITTTPVIAGSANAVLPVRVEPNLFGAAHPVNPAIAVAWTDITNPATLAVTPNADMQQLLDFQNLSFADIVGALQAAIDYLATLKQFSFLDEELPLLNASVTDLVDYADEFSQRLDELRNNPAGSLQLVEQAIEETFGLPPQSVTLSLDGSALRIELSFDVLVNGMRSIDIDLAALAAAAGGVPELEGIINLVDVAGGAKLSFEAGATLAIDLGIDLANPLAPRPFLYDTTAFTLEASASAANMNFSAALGPLGALIIGGTAVLDGDCNPATTSDAATFTVGLANDPTDGRYYFDEGLGTSIVTADLAGMACATLPVYFPTTSNYLGNIELQIADLSDVPGSITLTAPDINAQFGLLDLLDNLGGAIVGLTQMLADLQEGLSNQVFAAKLPLVGQHLRDGAHFFADIHDVLAPYAMDGAATKNLQLVRQILFDVLGPAGLDLLEDATADMMITIDDVVVTTTVDSVQFDLLLGQDVELLNVPLDFDIGLDGLGLEVDGGVQVGLGFQMALAFGVDKTDFFYLDTSAANELSVDLAITAPGLTAAGRLGPLDLIVTDRTTSPSSFTANFTVDLVDPIDPTNEDRLTYNDLVSGASLADVFDARFSGVADVNLDLVVSFGQQARFPSLAAEFNLDWQFTNTDPMASGTSFGSIPQIAFNNIRLDVGQFLSGFAKPLLEKVRDLTEPLQPIIDFLNAPVPLLSQLIGSNVTWLEVADGLTGAILDIIDSLPGGGGSVDVGPGFDVRFLTSIVDIIDLVNHIPTVGPGVLIPLGSFDLSSGDPRLLSSLSDATPAHVSTVPNPETASPQLASFYSEAKDVGDGGSPVRFPFLDDPTTAFQVLLGKTTPFDLVTYNPPPLTAGFHFEVPYVIPLPTTPTIFITVILRGDFDASADFKFGFDTAGLQLYAETRDLTDIFAGFYVDDLASTEFKVDGSITASIDVGPPGLHVGGGGGVFAEIRADLRDPDGDHKVRANELLENLEHGLLCTFDISGSVQMGLRISGTIGFPPFDVHVSVQPLPDVTILDFDVDSVDCFPDRFEPNDTLKTATNVGVAPGVHVADVSIASSRDTDWYRFEVLRPVDSIDVRLDFVPALGNLDLEVTDARGNNLGRSTTRDKEERVTLRNVQPGVYYVHAYGTSENSYKLFIDPGQDSDARVFYVNDGSVTDNQFYTLAPGNDANDGRSYLAPKATLADVLADYMLGPNDLVLFDTGTYLGGTSLITAADQGAAYAGSPAGSNLNYSGTRIEINDADDNLISRLVFGGGGGAGIHLRGDGINDAQNNLIRLNTFTGTGTGILVDSTQSNLIERNDFIGVSAGAYGIDISTGAAPTVRDNDVAGRSVGIRSDSHQASVIRNDVHDNSTGLFGSGTLGPDVPTLSLRNDVHNNAAGISVPSSAVGAVVRYNLVHDNNVGITSGATASQIIGNAVYDNGTGMAGSDTFGPADWSPNLANDIYGNSVGASASNGGIVQFNRIHNNVVGVSAGTASRIQHNLIYRNTGDLVQPEDGKPYYTGRGITVGGQNAIVENNTVYTTAGDAIRVQGFASNVTLRNNILWTADGYDIYVENDSQVGFASDYNNLFVSGLGVPVWWQKPFTDIYDWMVEGGFDAHSIGYTALDPTLDNPRFVDLAADNYHLMNEVSTSIDAGDPATPYALEPGPNGGRVNLGAYGNTTQAAQSRPSIIRLEYPSFYTDWVATEGRQILWNTFNVTGDVDIDLYQEGVGKVADIAVVPSADGAYFWAPQLNSIAGDTLKRYRIRVTSVAAPTVLMQSREAFAVPIAGGNYYIDDSSNASDEYTPTVVGNNRGTGKTPNDPKANLLSLLRAYDLGPADTVHVDTGNYLQVRNTVISGNLALGNDEGAAFTGPLNPAKVARLERGNPFSGDPTIDVNDGDFVTLAHLTLTAARHGVWVHNTSVNFTGADLSVFANSEDGARIEGDSVGSIVDRVTAYSNGRYGVYVGTPIASFSGNRVYNNANAGVILDNAGPVVANDNVVHHNSGVGMVLGNAAGAVLENNEVYANAGGGIQISSAFGGQTAVVGNSNLSLARGNRVYDNLNYGIYAYGPTLVVGNTVYGHDNVNAYGIDMSHGVQTLDNTVYDNYHGIGGSSSGGSVRGNRVYHNAQIGIYISNYDTPIEGNTVYSNSIGIQSLYHSGSIANNLVYANTNQGILVVQSAPRITNNTVYQQVGDAVRVQSSSNVTLRNNILWVQAGYDIYVPPDSQVGFTSDYNLLYTAGAGKVGSWQGVDRPTLGAWQSAGFTDQNSLAQNPLFVDFDGPENLLGYVSANNDGRNDDFHVQSPHGSFHGGSLAVVRSFTTGLPVRLTSVVVADAVQSPAIDRGDAATSFSNEPAPNGGFVNLGAYGNTAQGSKSPSEYVLVTKPDGGEVWPAEQTFPIRWRGSDPTVGHALGFDGVNDFVSMGDPASNTLDLGASATIEAWVRFNALPSSSLATIASKDQGPGTQNKWIFGYANNYAGVSNATFLHINGPGGSVFLSSSNWTPVIGQWYHLAIVKDGNSYAFYRDGVADGTASTAVAVPDVTAALEIGRAEGGFHFNGSIDEVRLWNVARSQPDILTNVEQLLAGNEFGLAGYWRFDEGAGSTAADLTAGGSDGSLGNGVAANQPAWGVSGVFLGVVDIDLYKGGVFDRLIATGTPNDGEYLWTVPASISPANDYSIRVTRSDPSPLADTSNATFTITEPITVYYVNDGSVNGVGDWTAAPGNDVNDGLTPATPKLSIRAILETYDLEPGDFIRVDDGTYDLGVNIVITAADSGVTIEGYHDPAYPTRSAVLNRGNVGGSSYVFELQNGDNVTLEHLSITGGYYGLYASPSSDSDDLTLLENTIYGNAYIGVYLQGTGNDRSTFSGNTFYGLPASENTNQNYGLAVDYGDAVISGNTFRDHASYGVAVGPKAMVTGNTVYANGTGISANGNFVTAEQTIVSGNTVYGNYGAGINAYGGVLIQSNMVYGQSNPNAYGINLSHGVQVLDNTVYDNYYGIGGTSSGGLIRGNRVYHNTQIGISVSSYDTPIEGNTVYSNSIGIQSTYHSGPIANNLIYANTNQGILVLQSAPRITNNTIYQQVGDAVRVQQSSSNVTLRNNILWVQAGYDLYVTPDSQVGFNSDYNLLYTVGAGKLGYWEGRDYLSRGDWFYELGLDAHSITDNPLLASPAGADGALGYVAGVDYGADDDFHEQPLAPTIDAGDPASAYLNETEPNGGRVNLGRYGNTPEAAASPESFIQVLSPAGLEKFEVGQQVTIQWRSHGLTAPGTVDIELMELGNPTPVALLADNAINTGSLSVNLPLGVTPGSQYQIRVRWNDANPLEDTSPTFLIANNGASYYVNDGSTTGDVFTTATGDNAHSGKSPDQPLASLVALLALYDLDPGDTIYLDAGTYSLAKNIVIGSQDAGVRIVGPQTAAAVLNRGNVGGSSYVFELQNADNVTLEHLSITGGYYGLYASPSSDSDDLTLLENTIYGNAYIGVYLQGTGNDRSTFSGNTFYGLPASENTNQNYGLAVDYGDAVISGNTFRDHASYGVAVGPKVMVTGNTVYANGTGISANSTYDPAERITVSGNMVYGNYSTGISAGGQVLIVGNTVYGQSNPNAYGINLSHGVQVLDNTVYDNYYGIGGTSSGGLIRGNRVYHNTQIGISVSSYDTPIEGNTVYSNSIGIQSTYHSGPIANNLIYANTNQGILVLQSAPRITNNTIYQQVGDAVRVQQSSSNVTLRNNILWVQAGYDLYVTPDSQVGFNSDYNLLYTVGAGKLGYWEGRDYLSRGDWFYELGLDAHSITDNPLLASPAGADGALGYVAGVDYGADDDFHEQPLAPTIDAGDPASAYLNETEPNGGRVNLGRYGNTPEAAASPESFIQVLSPAGLEKFEVGQQVTIQWRSHGLTAPGTVDIELMELGNPTPVALLADNAINTGSLSVNLPLGVTPGSQYQIRVRWNDANPLEDTSPTFLIANNGASYYVNDGSTTGDVFTTATGDNAHSGKSPDQPLASLVALLALYDLDPGDTIYLDAGTYSLAKNIVIGSQDAGVRIVGPQTAAAVLNRGNVGGSSYVFELQNADNVTLEHLSITGGYYGLYASPSSDSDDLTLLENTIYGNAYIGVYLQGTGNDRSTFSGNTFYGLPASENTNQNYGLAVDYGDAVISGNTFRDHASYGVAVGPKVMVTGNTVYANGTGISANSTYDPAERITVSGNMVYGNYSTGISAGGQVLIVGNTVYGQTNPNAAGINMSHAVETRDNAVYDNYHGIDVGSSGGLVRGNRVYHNTQIGISVSSYDTPIESNTVYSNSIGIQTTYFTGTLANNLIYSNTNQGLLVLQSAPRITNNTIYQQVGDAVRVQQSSSNVTLRNNILWVQAGYDIYVAPDSQVGFNSDYNLLYQGPAPNAHAAFWAGATRDSLGDWQSSSSQDSHSAEGDPKLVDIDGADNVLAYTTSEGGYDGSFDDNFSLSGNSPAIDRGDAWAAPATDIAGLARFNDPGTPNLGRDYGETDLGTSQYVAGGTARGWRADEDSWGLSLPFAFPFYESTYTGVTVSSNGMLQFSGPGASWSGANSAAELLNNRRVAPLWDDLRTDGVGDDIFVDTATAGQATIRWDATNKVDGSDVKFSVTLYTDGRIRFDYGPGNANLTPSVGISRGNNRNYRLSTHDGQTTLGNADSVEFPLADGFSYVDLGAYEFGGSSLDMTPPTVLATTPTAIHDAGGTSLTVSQIDVTFSEPLNSIDAIAPANYGLRGAGDDGVFNNGDDNLYGLTPSYVPGSTLVTLAVGGGALPDGRFRLTISGTSSIHDASGLRLDGDGDGAAGGDYVRTFTVDRTAPRVTRVLVGSTQWTPIFGDQMTSLANGTIVGYEIPSGLEQLRALPWINLNQVIVEFSEDVAVEQNDLILTGVAVPWYAIAGFNYNSMAHVAVWTLAQTIPFDALTVSLDGETPLAVVDVAGNLLDGEWIDQTSAFPSGNSVTGGDFSFRLNVVPADVNQDGVVDIFDVNLISSNWGSEGPAGNVNGDDEVDIFDINAVSAHWGAAAPGDVTPPTTVILNVSPDPRATAVNQISIIFSEPVTGFTLADVSLSRGAVVLSLAGAMLSTSDSATWTLDNLAALTAPVGQYLLTVGTGITDLVGNSLVTGATETWTVRAPGDVNGDGVVDIFDVNMVSANWGGSGPAGDGNDDGVVDIFDINMISANWGAGSGGGAGLGVNGQSPSTNVPGDVNGDRRVNALDDEVVSANWGGYGPAGDANGDGTVDIFDINWISANWTEATGSAATAGKLRQAPLAAGTIQTMPSIVAAGPSGMRSADDLSRSSSSNKFAATIRTGCVGPASGNRAFDLNSGRARSVQAIRAVDAAFGDVDLNALGGVELTEVEIASVALRHGPARNGSNRLKS